MTTTVKIVYVDPTGEVRMSPTGWPVEPKEKDFSGDQWKENDALQRYNKALKKAKEESIPFEDQEFFEDCKSMVLGEFYTIEPIQVEIVDQYLDNTSLKWTDIDVTEHVNVSLTRGIRTIARIVTEEEKPASEDLVTIKFFTCSKCGAQGVSTSSDSYDACGMCTGWKKIGTMHCDDNISQPRYFKHVKDDIWKEIKTDISVGANPEDYLTLPDLIEQKDGKQGVVYKEPAPVVDNKLLKKWSLAKWGNEEVLMRDGVMVAITWQEIVDELNKLHQQPTEWIPVSERLPDQKLKYVDVWIDKNGGYRFANYHLDHSIYPEMDFERIKEDFEINKITFWRTLPEPPKP